MQGQQRLHQPRLFLSFVISLLICIVLLNVLNVKWNDANTSRILGWIPPAGKLHINQPRSLLIQETAVSEDNVSVSSCDVMRLMPSGTFPPIALASFPGSGNTWVRHLIHTATGFATGSVYNSGILIKQGFIGEKSAPTSGKALTIKTHAFHNKMVGAILLVRNPYRAMVAEFNRRNAGKKGHVSMRQFKTQGWHKFVVEQTKRWMKLYQDYISHCNHPGNTCKSVLIVYYEQLQNQLEVELRRIFRHLSIPLDDRRLECALTNAEGVFHRPKRNETFDPFTTEQRKLVDSYVNKYVDLVVREGFGEPPLLFTSNQDTF